jgi:haloalkane dehalogenase
MMKMKQRPFEVDPNEYPFADHWLEMGDGCLHYIDEGTGPTVLLLHGNPTWSYLYRNVIKSLRGECRLVALDYPGFGMSQAPSHYDFKPQSHAKALTHLIKHLGLKNFVLVVQDWGGPIGMSYATQNPSQIRAIVLMNTWAWPASVPQFLFSMVMGGWPLGYWLQTRKNFFAKTIFPNGVFHKEKLSVELKNAYLAPFQTMASRIPTWIFPRQIRKAKKWLQAIESRLPVLADVPTQILWGQKDEPGFRPAEMRRWQNFFKMHETEVLGDASHFVQEDRPDRVIAAIRRALERTKEQEKK